MWAPSSVVKSEAVDGVESSHTGGASTKQDMLVVHQPPPPPPPLPVDMQAHVGLRGVAAVWIVVFHCLSDPKYHSGWVVALQGSSLMPLFFMLSGFSLTVTYGLTTWVSSSSSWCCPSRSRRNQQSHEESEGGHNTDTDAELMEEAKSLSSSVASASFLPASLEQPSPSSSSSLPSHPPFPTRAFYQNRLARVMPVYWLSILVSIPLWLLNLGDFPFALRTFLPSLATSVLPLTTLFSFLTGTHLAAINPVGWFVTTLVFFWLFFPHWLPSMQRLSDRALVNVIIWGFWLQLLLIQGIYSLMPFVTSIRPFGTATTNPLSRFPLFLMGMAAGVLALRYPVGGGGREGRKTGREKASSSSSSSSNNNSSIGGREEGLVTSSPSRHSNSNQLQMRVLNGAGGAAAGGGGGGGAGGEGGIEEDESIAAVVPEKEVGEEEVDAYMPWPTCIFGLPLPACLTPRRSSSSGSSSITTITTKKPLLLPPPPPRTQPGWARLATRQSVALLLLTLLISGIDTAVRFLSQGLHTISAQVWFQGLVAMMQLNIFLALTRDGGLSLASLFLRLPFVEWIGRISMNIYLIHYPLLGYLALAIHSSQAKDLPNCYNLGEAGGEGVTEGDASRAVQCQVLIKEVRELPWWNVFVVLPMAVVLGEALARWVEEPARRALRHGKGKA